MRSRSHSFVYHQPGIEEEVKEAYYALLACPTGSIGNRRRSSSAKKFMDDFPLNIDGDVYYAGFNSEKSYGGNSFFVKHGAGNWLVDSPKFLPKLVQKFRMLGGIKHIFPAAKDGVADANKYANELSAQRIIHKFDLEAEPDSEIVLDNQEPCLFAPDFEILPTPGHTRGTWSCLISKNIYSAAILFFMIRISSACQLRATIAGTHGIVKLFRWIGLLATSFNGYCPAMDIPFI